METIGAVNYDLKDTASEAANLEAMGADYIAAPDVDHDPMLQLAVAAGATSTSKLMTSICVAFARSPMTLALQGHDVNCLSEGRLIIGLGSQIKPHIEKRYSMEWSKPAARMREYVCVLRAIWDCWYKGTPLDFRGEFYTHSLMTPMFTPSNKTYGAPQVYVAAVGPLMTENAAEVGDGLMLHSFATEEYIRETMLPAVEAGLAKSGRSRKDLKIFGAPFMVTGETEEQFERTKQAVCAQISFYASTPAYKGVLESVGYGDLHVELLQLSKQGEWAEMGRRIDDNLLDKLALVGEPATVAEKLSQRYGDIIDICGASLMGTTDSINQTYSQVIAEHIKKI